MLTIWGRISSINVRKVVYTAQELGLPFQRLDAGSEFGVVRTPEYLARNPNALVPLLEDGAVQLWESNVIVRYLCAKHSPGRLYPLDPGQRVSPRARVIQLPAWPRALRHAAPPLCIASNATDRRNAL